MPEVTAAIYTFAIVFCLVAFTLDAVLPQARESR